MALLSSASDWQTALNKVLYAVEHTFGINSEGYVRNFQIPQDQKDQIIQGYILYKTTLPSRIDKGIHTIS